MSKLIEYPKFKNDRYTSGMTDAADCNENMDLWLKKPKEHKAKIDDLLIPSTETGSHRGYRFIRDTDLKEVVHVDQFFKFTKPNRYAGTHLELIFVRRYRRRDKFNPFWFGVESTTVIVKARGSDAMIVYESDAQLKRFIQTFNV